MWMTMKVKAQVSSGAKKNEKEPKLMCDCNDLIQGNASISE